MIPYVEHPSFTVGGTTIYAFGILAFTAVLIGVGIVTLRAPRIGVSRDDALDLVVWTIVAGFVGSHVFSEIAYYPRRVLEDPMELLRIWGSMSSFGGIVGGLLGAWIVMRRQKLSAATMWRFVDAVAFAFPFAWLSGRAGCSLAHDHVGIETDHWLAVRFPDGSRFDLGLLEFLWTIPIAVTFFLLDRKPRPDGFYFGLFFVLYAPARFVLDTLRVGDARYFGWTPSQYVCVLATIAGIVVLAKTRRAKTLH